MRPIHRSAVDALSESIAEIDDVCVDELILQRKQVRAQTRADLPQMRVRRLIGEMIEQQSQLATGLPRVEVMTEVGSRCSRQMFELHGRREVGRLLPQNPQRDSAVLGARDARVTQRRALRATSQRRHIGSLRSNGVALELQVGTVDARHCLCELGHTAPASKDR
jgi:hypothetical protein